jgi:hypothetical protein
MSMSQTGELRIRLRDLIGDPPPRPPVVPLDEQREWVIRMLLARLTIPTQENDHGTHG